MSDTAISFGEGTSDEMCHSFTRYWPKITSPQWSWTTASLLTRCRPTE